MMNEESRPVVSLKEAVVTGIVIDFIVLGITSTIMDGGRISGVTLCLAAGHWAGNILIIARRRTTLTKTDREFIRFGLLALAGAAMVAGGLYSILSSLQ